MLPPASPASPASPNQISCLHSSAAAHTWCHFLTSLKYCCRRDINTVIRWSAQEYEGCMLVDRYSVLFNRLFDREQQESGVRVEGTIDCRLFRNAAESGIMRRNLPMRLPNRHVVYSKTASWCLSMPCCMYTRYPYTCLFVYDSEMISRHSIGVLENPTARRGDEKSQDLWPVCVFPTQKKL